MAIAEAQPTRSAAATPSGPSRPRERRDTVRIGDRDRILDHLQRSCPTNVNVYAESGMGVSRLLDAVRAELETGDNRPSTAALNCSTVDISRPDSFVQAFWQTLIEAVPELGDEPHDVVRFAAIPQDREVILFLQEFDLVAQQLAESGGLGQLRAFGSRPNCALVIGTHLGLGDLLRQENVAYGSLFAATFVLLPIGLLSRDEAEALVQQELDLIRNRSGSLADRLRGILDNEQVFQMLLEEAGRFPRALKWGIQLIAQAADTYPELRDAKAYADWATTWVTSCRSDPVIREVAHLLIEHLKPSELEIVRALAPINLGLPAGGDIPEPVEVRELKLRGLIEERGPNGSGQALFSNAFAYWVQRLTAPLPNEVATSLVDDRRKLFQIFGQRIQDLTHNENRLLMYLMRRAGKTVSRQELMQHVWDGETLSRFVVEKGVYRLRQRIEVDPQHPRYLISKRGKGYVLRVEPVESSAGGGRDK